MCSNCERSEQKKIELFIVAFGPNVLELRAKRAEKLNSLLSHLGPNVFELRAKRAEKIELCRILNCEQREQKKLDFYCIWNQKNLELRAEENLDCLFAHLGAKKE